jgi:hypothetical protein
LTVLDARKIESGEDAATGRLRGARFRGDGCELRRADAVSDQCGFELASDG